MKLHTLHTTLLAAILVGTAPCIRAHDHLNAGAAGTDQDDPLNFDNGADFDLVSDYVVTLNFATNGTYTGYYQGNITMTALPTTTTNGGPAPNAPAPGSVIQAQLVSVQGPEGGVFGFWDHGAMVPTYSLESGDTGTDMWLLSQNDGSPGSDPFGHIHGRRFTATRPGIYTVQFKLHDTSTNGVGGGPIHTPSGEFALCFQAGVNLQSVDHVGGIPKVRFSAPLATIWQLEGSANIQSGDSWMPVGDPVVGDDHFHEVMDALALPGRFYRLNGTPE